ncbi:MAG: nucleotidyltransferase domain-containing protein, partial [Pseudomonadota bacterium]
MTLPQENSPARDSDALLHLTWPVPEELICPAQHIFDTATLARQLSDDLGPIRDEGARRASAVKTLATARKAGMAAIAAAFKERPFAARDMTRSYTYLTDCLVRSCFAVATQVLHPLSTPTEQERISVLAVGGYGRGEMAPHSDVDLLFLTPYKLTPWAESVIESMLYMLWDIRLKVGQSSRTIKDCMRLGAEDFTIRTAMLEHRFVEGDAETAVELDTRLWEDLFKGTEAEFIEAKLAERDVRHIKQGQRYVVEPNVKEGKGGLRDLQSLFWIAKYVHGVHDVAALVALDVFTEEEFATFEAAESFLWAVRGHLHLISGRASEQLTFDLQVEVAAQMGYEDGGGRRGVEIFMQHYFRHATSVGDLTRIFLTKLEA